MPPVAANGAAGDELRSLVDDVFVDVGVALENGDDVVAFEEVEDVGRVGDGERVVFASGGDDLSVGGKCGDHRAVDDADDGSGWSGGFQIGAEPIELIVIDAGFPEAILGEMDGIENEEVIPLVIEGVVGAAVEILEHFLAVGGIGRHGAAFRENTEGIVIADGVMNREGDELLGFLVEAVDQIGAKRIDAKSVEDVIAALDGKIRIERSDFAEAHVASVSGIQFGLDVRVREENEVEGTWGGRGGQG